MVVDVVMVYLVTSAQVGVAGQLDWNLMECGMRSHLDWLNCCYHDAIVHNTQPEILATQLAGLP